MTFEYPVTPSVRLVEKKKQETPDVLAHLLHSRVCRSRRNCTGRDDLL